MTRAFGKDFDTTFDSQQVFRCLLKAASNPGNLFTLPTFDREKPEEAILLTLLDHETSFRILDGEPGVEARMMRTTGSHVASLDEADFALIHDPHSEVSEMKRGTLDRPELGATAVYVIERLSNSGTITLELSGPGVSRGRTLGVEEFPATEVEAIQASRAEYPLGVDVYIVDGSGQLCGLPRSTKLEVI